jgi:hypothetical protein
VRLFVGALTGGVYEKLRASGAVSRIGATSVWQSRQTALLAAYEELAGPAVVTRQVIATLEECVVPLVV